MMIYALSCNTIITRGNWTIPDLENDQSGIALPKNEQQKPLKLGRAPKGKHSPNTPLGKTPHSYQREKLGTHDGIPEIYTNIYHLYMGYIMVLWGNMVLV